MAILASELPQVITYVIHNCFPVRKKYMYSYVRQAQVEISKLVPLNVILLDEELVFIFED